MNKREGLVFNRFYPRMPRDIKHLYLYFATSSYINAAKRPDNNLDEDARRLSLAHMRSLTDGDLKPNVPPALVQRCAKVLAREAAPAVAPAKAPKTRRGAKAAKVLRLDLQAGWGEVISFPGNRRAAA